MPTTDAEIHVVIQRIHREKSHGRFKPYIDSIQFPKYKNFQKNLRVTFPFPVTVIVGQNGSGKTSLLQALSGAPHNSSPGLWWFGTPLDPIDSEDGRQVLSSKEKAAFWYEYTDRDGSRKRALKLRIRREGDPDYWEPSRPVAAYGMEGKDRHPAVHMQATYMNFKTQLSAFDRCFYFAAENTALLKNIEKSRTWQRLLETLQKSRRRRPRIQDYLRARARKLRSVLVDGRSIKSGRHYMHKDRVTLSPSELADISRIIGREYTSGVVLEHRFYETWATSVLFGTPSLQYSEAFAGSGESAVVRLVSELSKCKDGGLLLLDEPETSLHPGAQHELIRYLLQKTAEKKLQVVISTHSPSIVRCLPPDAIRVLSLDVEGFVRIDQDVSADEAFYVLGHPPENRIHVIVEDLLAQKLIEAVLDTMGSAIASRFTVSFRPGGESGMKSDAAIYMLDPNQRVVFLFDGDKRETCGPFDLSSVSVLTTSAELDALIGDKLDNTIKFRQDSNMAEEDKRNVRLKYMEFVNKHFRCFPFESPEELLWDDSAAKQLLFAVGASDEEATVLANAPAKTKFDRLTHALRPTSSNTSSGNIQTVHDMLLSKFCRTRGPIFEAITALLREIANND